MTDKVRREIEMFDVVRSYKSSILIGRKLLVDKISYFVRLLLPFFLFGGLSFGVCGTLGLQLNGDWHSYALFAALLLFVVLLSFVEGCTLWAVRSFSINGELPNARRFSLYREALPLVLKAFYANVVFFLALLLPLHFLTGVFLWVHLAVELLFGVFVAMFYANLLLGEASPLELVKNTFSLGFRHYGSTLLVLLIPGIFVLLSSLIFMMPSLVLSLSQGEAVFAELIGDKVDLPFMFNFMLFVSWTVSGVLFFFLPLIVLLPLTYHFFSVMRQREERMELDREQ